jgi:hypothetical protein
MPAGCVDRPHSEQGQNGLHQHQTPQRPKAKFRKLYSLNKEKLDAQINKANQNKTVDLYGNNVKTAECVPGGSFMHVQQAMVSVVANDLRNGQIIYKTGIDAFSGAVSGNMQTKNMTDPEYPSRHDYPGARRCN